MLVAPSAARKAAVRRLRPLAAAFAGVLVLTFAFAGTALADNATINVLTTSGQSDPAAGLPRTWSVTGATAAPEHVFVKFRNPGGAPCAPTANSDTGSTIEGYYDNPFWYGSVNGSFNLSDVLTWNGTGTYMFCIWIAGDGNSSVTPITQMITFRSPTGTISATVNPFNPAPGATAAVTIVGVSEAPETVYATVHNAGIPCSLTYDADRNLTGSSSIDSGTNVNGNFSVNDSVEEDSTGNYGLCLWLAGGSSDTAPIAGPQTIPFTVGAPTPPVTHAAPHGVSKECKSAKSSRTKWTKAVQRTKRSLLKARKKATRRKLTKQLAAERRKLKIATSNVKTIC